LSAQFKQLTIPMWPGIASCSNGMNMKAADFFARFDGGGFSSAGARNGAAGGCGAGAPQGLMIENLQLSH
jgi:hypothetical protein